MQKKMILFMLFSLVLATSCVKTVKPYTPLMKAVKIGDLKETRSLIVKGVDIDEEDAFSNTALQIACAKGNLKMVKLLLENGANINKITTKSAYIKPDDSYTPPYYYTPLIIAIQNNHIHIIKYLIKKGVNVNPNFDGLGDSPLMKACRVGNLEIVHLLLKKGAYAHYRNYERNTPLYFATLRKDKKTEREKIVRLLKKYLMQEENILIASARGDYKKLKRLIRLTGKLNFMDEDKNTPLTLAVRNKHFRVIKYLIKKGADFNIKGVEGMTPLILAVKNRDFRVTSYLLKKGANLKIVCSSGKTPLDYAKEKGYKRIIALLKKYGAKE